MQNSKFFSKTEKVASPLCFLLRKSQSLRTQVYWVQWSEVLMFGRILIMLSSSSNQQSELDILIKTSAGQMEMIGELNGK